MPCCLYVTIIDGSRIPVTVECSTWTPDQPQRDSKVVSGIRPTVKSTSGGMASQRKISEDDDDASDSERMVICEDETAGNEPRCSLEFTNAVTKAPTGWCFWCQISPSTKIKM